MTQFSWLRGNPLFAGGSCSSVCGAAEDVSDQAAQRGGNSVSERDRYLRKPSRTAHFTFLLWGTSFEVNRWVHVEVSPIFNSNTSNFTVLVRIIDTGPSAALVWGFV